MSDDLTYAGDVTPERAWEILKGETSAHLVDVRTDAEFAYVGIVDLSSIGKEPILLPWKVFPKMEPNPHFVTTLSAQVLDPATALLFLCRSGQRSRAAAAAMTAEGYSRCYNVLYGFEGDRDAAKHRGIVNGWKVSGLPWVQG